MESTVVKSTDEEIEISFRKDNSSSLEVSIPKRKKDVQDTFIIPYPHGFSISLPKGVTARMPVEMNADRYNMHHKRRGKCIVFNQQTNTLSEDRADMTVDAFRIIQAFKNLGFVPEIYLNLDLQPLMERLRNLSKEDHGDADCICIFVLTHCSSEGIFWANDKSYKAEDVWKLFTADKCRTLAGKPKLFFFHTCQAEEENEDVPMLQNDDMDFYKIPTFADFLIVHCSPQGFYSRRRSVNGTFFVECLCEVLTKFADSVDLLKMITITMLKITEYEANEQRVNDGKSVATHVPSITSMLLRDIYLTPKD